MKVKRAIFSVVLVLLAITTIAGCSPQLPPEGNLSAKEAWDIISPAKDDLDYAIGNDVVPVYIEGIHAMQETATAGGETSIWAAGFYSESERAVYEARYHAEISGKVTPRPGIMSEARYSDVSLAAYDLTGSWNIDSPEACGTAAQNGAGKTDWIMLEVAGLGVLDKDFNFFKAPEFIPESTELLWVILDENNDFYYIDASTGEYLGNCTADYLNNFND